MQLLGTGVEHVNWETVKFFAWLASAICTSVAGISVAYLHLFIRHAVANMKEALTDTLTSHYVSRESYEELLRRVERLENWGRP